MALDFQDNVDPWDDILRAPSCLWFGLPPCPNCGYEHGDPKCAEADDREKRNAIIKALRAELSRLRASLASAESRLAIAAWALENIRDEGDLHSHLQAKEALRQVRSKP